MFTQFLALKKLDSERPDFLPLALVFLVTVAIYFIGLNTFGIIDPGEAYYAEAAREMVESGDYITPHLNYQVYFSKPILTFWLMAFAYRVFGVSEFSTRIIFACLVGVLLAGTYWLARSLYNRRCGIFAALITATMPLLLACAKLSPIDIAFACFLNLCIFALAFSALFKRSSWTLFIYVFLALATLTKGPAAFVLTAFGTGVFLLAERAGWSINFERLKKLKLPTGMAILALITLPWYCAVGLATGGLFLKVFLVYENLARFAGATNMAHTTWYHYALVMTYALFPWIIFLPQSLWSALKLARNRNIQAPEQVVLFLACWGLSVIAFFSISRTQLDTYILPAIPPLSIVIAYYIEGLIAKLTKHIEKKTSISIVSSIFGGLGVIALFGALALPVIKLPGRFLEAIPQSDLSSLKLGLFALAIVMSAGYLYQYYCFRNKKYVLVFASLITTSVLLAVGMTQVAFQALDKSGQKDLRIICQELRDSGDKLAVFQAFKPSIMFYSLRPVTSFFHATQLLPQRDENESGEKMQQNPLASAKQLIILHEKSLPLFTVSPSVHMQLLKRRGQWLLYQSDNGKFENMQTLEAMFSNWEMITRLMKNQSDVGPLTVPYAAGSPNWWQEKNKNN